MANALARWFAEAAERLPYEQLPDRGETAERVTTAWRALLTGYTAAPSPADIRGAVRAAVVNMGRALFGSRAPWPKTADLSREKAARMRRATREVRKLLAAVAPDRARAGRVTDEQIEAAVLASVNRGGRARAVVTLERALDDISRVLGVRATDAARTERRRRARVT